MITAKRAGHLAMSVAISLMLPATAIGAPANNDPIAWSWTCKSSGFYEVSVFPDGNYKPEADSAGSEQIYIINARKTDQDVIEGWCDNKRITEFYYMEMKGPWPASAYTAETAVCDEATTKFEFSGRDSLGVPKHKKLNDMEQSMNKYHLVISRDDNDDWRFVLSYADLTTKRQAKELNIVTHLPIKYEARANMGMVTGACVMTANNDDY